MQINEATIMEEIKSAIKKAINEIGYRGATLSVGANMKAEKDLADGDEVGLHRKHDNYTKLDKSASIMYDAISKSVIDTIGWFSLLFRKPEKEGFLTSLVTFHFNEIIYIDKDCFIMQGDTEMSKHPIPSSKYRHKPQYVQIEYNFSKQEFREVVYCANKTIRRKNILKLGIGNGRGIQNKDTADKLILHMTNCMYSIEDYSSNV